MTHKREISLLELFELIDIGDGCSRPNVLVTRFGCWCQDLNVSDKSRHQHRELGTNIKYQSPTPHSGVL